MAGMTVPVFLITAGALFLLMEFYAISIQWTWPVLPLVIGAVKLLQRETPGKTHVPAGYSAPLRAAGAPGRVNLHRRG
ncbi:MAG: hypothetical protein ABSD88_08985 [Candidatus Korobacteraceae bacterium]|jgi:hypothetical protein